ncbi:MAG: Nicotinate dehydrogenase small FeS subunit [Chloroflexi bacterium]|nr:Nicotinate dehydrogenase small FeS subunit [Chloroflexota bacterium]
MWKKYYNVSKTDEVLGHLAAYGKQACIMAGGTDLVVEMKHGAHSEVEVLIDISRVPGWDEIRLDDEGQLHLGPMVTHNDCVASPLVRDYAAPLAKACREVGSPQIRNRGTVAGNLVTASPANDTISPLMAMGAKLILVSARGERVIPLDDFYLGVRETVLFPDEIVREIVFPAMADNQRGTYQKLGLRKAQAISLVNMAVILTMDGDTVKEAVITLGAVAPTIIHAEEGEAYLRNKVLDEETIARAASLAERAARSIDDVRGSASYRNEMSRVLVGRGLREIAAGQKKVPPRGPFLQGPQKAHAAGNFSATGLSSPPSPIKTTINGETYVFESGHEKTLLDLIRYEAGLTGSKEGCGEGECGACTVFLDGEAVMACLVPAPRGHGAEIVTVEGVGQEGELHPVQEAFISAGAVQCGFCTPGFVMSAVKLLEEEPTPTRAQIHEAISGNLCRCTGYYKIVQAIESAANGRLQGDA